VCSSGCFLSSGLIRGSLKGSVVFCWSLLVLQTCGLGPIIVCSLVFLVFPGFVFCTLVQSLFGPPFLSRRY
jgi:hypothetical protein